MNPRLSILLWALVLSVTSAHEYTVFHQQTSWNPQKFTQNIYESAIDEFTSLPVPALTQVFDSPTEESEQNSVGEKINEQCTLYKARLTQKELYFQYIRYKTEIPDLKEFTLCIWMRSNNLSNDHTILSYAVDGQPHEIRSWLSNSDRSSYFNLAVGGSDGRGSGESVHLFSINYPFRRRRWYHTCQSWSGETGNWLVYVEGERIGAGNSPKTIGRVIRGGGVAVTGQTQSQPGGGFIEEGGYEGEVTLFKLLPKAFSRPLKLADVEGTRMYQTSCDGLCKARTPRPAAIRVRSHPKASESRLTSRAREMLSLSPDRPIRVFEMQSGASQARHAYSVKEEGSVGNPLPAQVPSSFLTQYNNALRHQVTFQTTPVADGGVQLFYKPAEGSRVSRSLDHFLFDIAPRALPHHLAESGFVYRPKQLLLPNAFVPDLDLAQRHDFLGQLQLPQSAALQQQLNRQLLAGAKPLCPQQENGEGRSKVTGERRPASASTVSHVTVAARNEGGRGIRLVVQKPEAARVQQAKQGFELQADGTAMVTDVTPVIDWRMTPKKLYAGAMWLRANPVCRKF